MSSEGNITVIESFSADDTHALGVTLGQQAKPGDVCTLVGDLGVGKTVLTQGIAEGAWHNRADKQPYIYHSAGVRGGEASVLSFRCIQDW